MNHSNPRAGMALLLVAGLTALPVLAADVPGQPNEQIPSAPRPLPRSAGEGFELPPVAPAAVDSRQGAAGAFVIRRVVLRGNTVIATAELDAIAAAYLGRALNESDLEELRLKLTRRYIERGYITSGALLNKGAVSGDTVTYDLVEGRVSSVRLQGLDGLRESYVVDRLLPDREAPLNMDVLRERYQRLLEDPLISRMNARLLPDARLGEAVLDIDVNRALPYQITAFANNYRPPSIGGSALGFTGMVRNLTGYGDQLEATASSASQSGGERYSASWRLPLNAWGTVFTLQWDQGRSSVVEEATRSLDIRSQLHSTDVGLSQTVWESGGRKLILGLDELERKNSSTLLGQPYSFSAGEVDGVTQASAWRVWQDYGYRDERQALGVRSTFTFAKSNLQPLVGLPAGAAEVDPNYALWLGQLQYVRQVLDNDAQLAARLTVQASHNSLSSLDKMAIGGVYTVRGYVENTLVRDTGNILNLEFHYPIVRNPGRGFNLNLIPFYDRGTGRNRNQSSDTLSSAGLALHMTLSGATMDLAVASRLQYPSSLALTGSSLQDKGIHFQLSYNAF